MRPERAIQPGRQVVELLVPGHLEFQHALRVSAAESSVMADAGGARTRAPRAARERRGMLPQTLAARQSGSPGVGRMGFNVAYAPADLNVRAWRSYDRAPPGSLAGYTRV